MVLERNDYLIGIDCGASKVLLQSAKINHNRTIISKGRYCKEYVYSSHPDWDSSYQPIPIDASVVIALRVLPRYCASKGPGGAAETGQGASVGDVVEAWQDLRDNAPAGERARSAREGSAVPSTMHFHPCVFLQS